MSPLATTDVSEATLFLVNVCIMGRGQQGAWSTKVMPFLRQNDVLRSLLERNDGHDFAVTLTSDHGPCPNFYEKGLKEHQETWHAPELANFILLMNEVGFVCGFVCV